MRKVKELTELTVQELREQERQLVEERYNLRFQKVTGQLENPGRIKVARRQLARIKTLIRARELEEQKA